MVKHDLPTPPPPTTTSLYSRRNLRTGKSVSIEDIDSKDSRRRRKVTGGLTLEAMASGRNEELSSKSNVEKPFREVQYRKSVYSNVDSSDSPIAGQGAKNGSSV